MKVYQIDYDLRKQRNYDDLYKKIKAYGVWCHAMESTWLIATQQTAIQVRDSLKQAMDADDGLLVTRLQGEGAWTGLSSEISSWLKSKLEACSV